MDELIQERILERCVKLFRDEFSHFETANKIQFEIKEDGSLVSNLERKIEEVVGDYLQKRTPWAGFQGEEGVCFEASEGSGEYKWFLDPIDGTISFCNGLDGFAFTLTLVQGSKALATIIDFPRLSKTYTAYSGKGAWLNGKPISVPRALKGEKGVFAISDDYTFAMTGRRPILEKLHNLPFILRTITDIYGYCMVAEGKCVAKFDAAGALWDLWPGYLLITETGGSCLFFSVINPTPDLAGSMLVGQKEVIEEIYHHLKTTDPGLPDPLLYPCIHK